MGLIGHTEMMALDCIAVSSSATASVTLCITVGAGWGTQGTHRPATQSRVSESGTLARSRVHQRVGGVHVERHGCPAASRRTLVSTLERHACRAKPRTSGESIDVVVNEWIEDLIVQGDTMQQPVSRPE